MEQGEVDNVIQALRATRTGGPLVPSSEHVRRFQLARAFVGSGIPLHKLSTELLSNFLQVYSGGAVDRTLLVDYCSNIVVRNTTSYERN